MDEKNNNMIHTDEGTPMRIMQRASSWAAGLAARFAQKKAQRQAERAQREAQPQRQLDPRPWQERIAHLEQAAGEQWERDRPQRERQQRIDNALRSPAAQAHIKAHIVKGMRQVRKNTRRKLNRHEDQRLRGDLWRQAAQAWAEDYITSDDNAQSHEQALRSRGPSDDGLTPCDKVLAVFEPRRPNGQPMNPTHAQRASVDQFGAEPYFGCWDRPGTGKTLTMFLHAAYAMVTGGPKQWVVLTPPTVIPNWVAQLRSIPERKTGKPLTVCEYLGTPAQRRKLPIDTSHFIVMSYEVFKLDFQHLTDRLVAGNPNGVGLVCDEGHKIKNMDTANWRHVYAWYGQGVPIKVATGTPLSTPKDIYTYTRLKNPDAYRNFKHFCDLHVAEEDAYERVTKWDNLDLARRHHMVRATEVLLSDVRKDLPQVSVEEWAYELAPAHKRLYDRLAEERVVAVEGTGKRIDAVSVSSLYHQCQQLVLNWGEFAGDATLKPRGLELAEQWLDELGEEKLIIVANYRRTNAMLVESLKSYGSRLMYGDMTHKQKLEAKDDFINDPKVRVLIMQPEAGGVGIDGLQHVCHSMLFLESPSIARPYTQAVARVDRTGQTNPVQVRIAVAAGTVQAGSYQRLLNNDALLAHVQLTPATLRQMIFGKQSQNRT